ncbi:MAG: neutral/alkaline non-lysosomal ceramidase N-terminal domain-containing protein [Candidatus Helarchaeota archaeon]|nr:neutral/alkaline non-lysosomal ceramidase N-terminal domain-containing protein [Candidatus Helarchaeota archaeon]
MSNIGFSEVKITPKAKSVPMGGYAPTRYSTGVHDELFARAMYFSDGKEETIIISVEVVCIYYRFIQRMRKKISEKTGVRPENILISSHHNHSGPDTLGLFDIKGFFTPTFNLKMMTQIELKIVKSAVLAKKNAKPGKIGLEKRIFEKRVMLNRRDPQKDTKYDLSVLRVNSDDGEMRGLLTNYACHVTTLPRDNTLLTGEFPGYLVRRIKDLTKNKVFSMYTNGPCGDLNPNLYPENEPFHLITKERLSKSSYGEFNRLGNYKTTIRIGYSLGESALEIAKTINCSEIKDIKVVSKIINIPLKDMMEDNSRKSIMRHISFIFKKLLITTLLNYNRSNMSYVSFVKKRGNWYFQTELQAIKINDILILSVPGELFVDLGKKVISKSPIKKTFIIELGNDWIGYLYPPEEYFRGGYETGIVSFSPVAGIYVYNKMLNLLNNFK